MSCDGVVRSTDGGQTWTPLTDETQARLKNFVGDEVRVPASNGSMIYAVYVSEGGTSRIRVSTDDGKTWTGSDTDYSGLSDILVDDQKPARAWALSQNGVLITNDSGQTWTPDVTGLDAAHNTAAGSQGAYQLSAWLRSTAAPAPWSRSTRGASAPRARRQRASSAAKISARSGPALAAI